MTEHYLEYEIRKLQRLVALRHKQRKIYTPKIEEYERLQKKIARLVWLKVDMENRFGHCSPRSKKWPL